MSRKWIFPSITNPTIGGDPSIMKGFEPLSALNRPTMDKQNKKFVFKQYLKKLITMFVELLNFNAIA